MAPFREPAKILGTFPEWLVAHRLKHLKILVALLAVILVSRHAGNAASNKAQFKPRKGPKFANSTPPHLLTLDRLPVKGSTEKFLCVLHFIGCSFFYCFQRWL